MRKNILRSVLGVFFLAAVGYAQSTNWLAMSPVDTGANPGAVVTGSVAEVQAFFEERGWTDGLPIIPPSLEKVEKCLLCTPHAGSEKVYGDHTVYNVAANAIMAGCKPEHMPVCLAIVKAMNDPEVLEPLRSSHASTPYVWLNGPLSRQLMIDSQQGMISAKNNKALARFVNLALLNIAGIDMNATAGTFGSIPSFVFAEDEEACRRVGWEPYHVQLGTNLNANTLTFSTATCWGNNLTPASPSLPDQTLTMMAWDITEKEDSGLGGGNSHCHRTVFISESIANVLVATNTYSTKAKVESALRKQAQRSFSVLQFSNLLKINK